MDLFLIDASAPFFRGIRNETINWSKIPFFHLEDEDGLDATKFHKIHKEFKQFIDTVAKLGYNAISLDDLAHLVAFDFYPKAKQSLISAYQKEFSILFNYARQAGLKIFINTDVIFFNPWIEAWTANRRAKIAALLITAVEKLFQQFNVDGIIFRIGESDGIDVKGNFKSQLVLRTPRQANKLIKQLLPLFENHNKMLVFRTWTVGIYPIGDLMWNKATFSRIFADIHSDHLIISMKFGDTDFFDDLELNPLFAVGSHKKIVELQARREREGFGEWPYFVGWQYEKYYQKLASLPQVIGVSVWCQTGGWSAWRNRTFLKESSIWNEMNTCVIIDIYKHRLSADESLVKFFNNEAMISFVGKAYQLIHDILYIKEFSEHPLYFRRLRIPPLIWLFWDHVVLNPLLLSLMQYCGAAKYKIPKKELADFYDQGKKLGIHNIDYLHDTFSILARCRRIMWKKSIKAKQMERIKEYKNRYEKPLKFSIHMSHINDSLARIGFRILLRRHAHYRFIDFVMLSPLASTLFRLLYRLMRKSLPSFANKQAMRVDMLFK